MNDVIFENDEVVTSTNRVRTKKGLPSKLVKWGVAANEKQANFILLVFSMFMFLAIFIIFSLRVSGVNDNVVDPETIDQSSVPGT